MVTITKHVFINFIQTEHFLAVKFYMGYEKYELSCDTKISKSLEKNKLKIRRGSCKLTILKLLLVKQGFFSKFLMGGDSKFSVPVGPRRGRSRMGGDLRKKSD